MITIEDKEIRLHGRITSGAALKKWRRQIGITRPVYARLSHCSERTLATFEARKNLSLAKERKLNETHRLLLALCEVMAPLHVKDWLNQPNEWLHSNTPMQIIEKGQIDLLWDLIYHTRNNGYL